MNLKPVKPSLSSEVICGEDPIYHHDICGMLDDLRENCKMIAPEDDCPR
uniref:Uncharacterized protein n=1 Tax=Peronospora matthiolae TaxID=2874970 RepID=A0AAV1UP94_9STRA